MTKLEQAALDFFEADAAFNRCIATEELFEGEEAALEARKAAAWTAKQSASERRLAARKALLDAALERAR